MSGGALFVDISAEVAGHLAVAVRLYRQNAMRNGQGVPPELREIELEVAARAMRASRGHHSLISGKREMLNPCSRNCSPTSRRPPVSMQRAHRQASSRRR